MIRQILYKAPLISKSPRTFNRSFSMSGITSTSHIQEYLAANRQWAGSAKKETLEANAAGQAPHTLWIGCSDSRCSEFSLSNLQPGEIFTHRNIANIVSSEDVSSKAVIKFAVDVLKVKKVLLVGHTECGGVAASLLIDNKDYYKSAEQKGLPAAMVDWLKPLIDLKFQHNDALADAHDSNRALVKLNVKQQIKFLLEDNEVTKTAVKEKRIEVHGLIYDVATGLLEVVE